MLLFCIYLFIVVHVYKTQVATTLCLVGGFKTKTNIGGNAIIFSSF